MWTITFVNDEGQPTHRWTVIEQKMLLESLDSLIRLAEDLFPTYTIKIERS